MDETGLASLEADLTWLGGVIADTTTSGSARAVATRARAALALAYATLRPAIVPGGVDAVMVDVALADDSTDHID